MERPGSFSRHSSKRLCRAPQREGWCVVGTKGPPCEAVCWEGEGSAPGAVPGGDVPPGFGAGLLGRGAPGEGEQSRGLGRPDLAQVGADSGGRSPFVIFLGPFLGSGPYIDGRNPQRLCSCWPCSMGVSLIFSAFLFLFSYGFSL